MCQQPERRVALQLLTCMFLLLRRPRVFHKCIFAGPKSLASTTRSYGKLKTAYTRKKTEDDLWAMARLLLLKDIAMMKKEYGPPDHKMRHPERQTRGILIERNVVEFVFLTSLFARDKAILKDFYDSLQGLLPDNAELYSRDTLHKMIHESS